MFKLDFIHKKYRTKLDSYGIVSIIIFGKSLPSLLAVRNISDSQFCYSRISISFSFMILLCYLCFWFIMWAQSDYLFGAMFLKSPFHVSPNQIRPLLWYQSYQSNGLIWWRRWDSNSWPLGCEPNALPTELRPHIDSVVPTTTHISIIDFWQKINRIL